jgi:hypothetical protein
VTCKLCGFSKTLIKAHIIPESFFKEASNGGGAQLISTNLNEFPKRLPIGPYDKELLCKCCEEKFQELDDFGARVFLSQHDELFVPMLQNEQVYGFSSDKIDKEKLHRFIISILWRASASVHAFYSKVNLGPHTDSVKKLIFEYDRDLASPYTFMLARWVSSPGIDAISKVQIDPAQHKTYGVNCYLFYFGKSLVYIKVDQRRFPHEYSNLELYAHDKLFAVARNLDESKELQLMKIIVHGIPKKRPGRLT